MQGDQFGIMLELDHLAVAGNTLAEASDAIETALGVALQPGGRHDVFATHNRLLGLADGLYLEAIAIDPDVPTPASARWFDLDRFDGAARLSNWICRTDDLTSELADLPADAGAAVSLQRGNLTWDMAVPRDGILPYDNMHPALIQWRCDQHPGTMLADSGCQLRQLVVMHPQADQLQANLSDQFRDARVIFENGSKPELMAEFDTPHGRRILR